MDEAGVGTIAGPLLAAAVHLPDECDTSLLRADAKSLSHQERAAAFERLRRTPGLVWACGAVPHDAVDRLGTRAAVDSAMALAAAKLERRMATVAGAARPVSYLVDGEFMPRGLDGETIVRGDQSELSIAAASIVASMAHQATMGALARRWPLWDLEINAGWPSRTHLQRIAAHGPAPCHRASTFPFRRRHGRRMSYHADRAAFGKVQQGLRDAATAASREAMPMGGRWRPRTEKSAAVSTEAERERERRYRDFYLRSREMRAG